jgi:trehalose 6-phosphate phosphatase
VLDFDGTLSEIVARPEHARPVDGAREALVELARRFRTVAIVTGRRSEEVAALLDAPHVTYVGLYGLEDGANELVTAIVPLVQTATAEIPEAWVEDKGVSVAVHYRQAPDPVSVRGELLVALQPVATEAGLVLIEGKMVLELVPPDRPLKGGAVERLVGEHALEALLYAGDDHADLAAFAALDRLSASEEVDVAVRVAVRGPETPPALIEAADVVAEGPEGLVDLLRTL